MSEFVALRLWWLERASDEADKVIPKAVEYGSTDLVEIGKTLATTMGRKVSDEEAAEIGVYFYVVGKLARWTDAVRDGRRPSDDTLYDLGVYAKMAQRIRHSGGWPAAPAPTRKPQETKEQEGWDHAE